MEDGKRHILQKLVQGPDGPNWELTSKGRLRMRELNEWEVMIPAIGHRYNKKRKVWETFSDQVVITDKELTRNTRAFGDRLDAERSYRVSSILPRPTPSGSARCRRNS